MKSSWMGAALACLGEYEHGVSIAVAPDGLVTPGGPAGDRERRGTRADERRAAGLDRLSTQLAKPSASTAASSR